MIYTFKNAAKHSKLRQRLVETVDRSRRKQLCVKVFPGYHDRTIPVWVLKLSGLEFQLFLVRSQTPPVANYQSFLVSKPWILDIWLLNYEIPDFHPTFFVYRTHIIQGLFFRAWIGIPAISFSVSRFSRVMKLCCLVTIF